MQLKISKDQKKKIDIINRSENLTLDFDEDDLPPILPLEDDEEIKLEPEELFDERVKLNPLKWKKNRNSIKNTILLTRLAILLAQIKAGSNSYKLKS